MRKPTFAVISALVIACGSASSTSGVSDAGGGDDGSGGGGSGGGGGSSGSASGSSGGSGGSGGSASSSGSGSGSGSSSGSSSSGADAGSEGGGSGCPAGGLPAAGTPCTPTDGGTCFYSVGATGGASCTCKPDDAGFSWQCLYTAGRRPEHLAPAPHDAGGPSLRAFLAEAAHLEGASVIAFRVLRGELRAHGAPRRLLRRASRAAREEQRHARRVGALARRWGGRAPSPEVPRRAVRPLGDIAVENAVEGCVRETFGALVAAWQASRARDRGVRATMRGIARDEARHAALSWEVAQWAGRRLSAEDRGRVEAARRQAVEVLRAEVRVEPPRALVETLGLPTAAEARRLLDGLLRALDVEAN